MISANKPDPANLAMALWLTIEGQWRCENSEDTVPNSNYKMHRFNRRFSRYEREIGIKYEVHIF